MDLSYKRTDSYSALPAFQASALQGCLLCESLIPVIRRAVGGDSGANLSELVTTQQAEPLVLKLSCIQLNTLSTTLEDTYPGYIEGEVSVGEIYKPLCIGFVQDMSKTFSDDHK